MSSSDPDSTPKLFASGNRRPSAPAPILDKLGVPIPVAAPPARFRSGTSDRTQAPFNSGVSPSPANVSRTGSDSGVPGGAQRTPSASSTTSPLHSRGRERAPSSPIRTGAEKTGDATSTSLPPTSALAAHGKPVPRSPLARKPSEPNAFPVPGMRNKVTPPFASPLSATSDHSTAAPSPPLPDFPPPQLGLPPAPPPVSASFPPPPFNAPLPPPPFDAPLPPLPPVAPPRVEPLPIPDARTLPEPPQLPPPPPVAAQDTASTEIGSTPSSGSLRNSTSSLHSNLSATASPVPSPRPGPQTHSTIHPTSGPPPSRPPPPTPKLKSGSSRSVIKASAENVPLATAAAGVTAPPSITSSQAENTEQVSTTSDGESTSSASYQRAMLHSSTTIAMQAIFGEAQSSDVIAEEIPDASISLFDTVDRRQFASMVEMAAVARAEGPDLLTARRTLRLSKHIGTLRRQKQPVPVPWIPESLRGTLQQQPRTSSPNRGSSDGSASALVHASSSREDDLLEVQSLIEVQERAAGTSPARAHAATVSSSLSPQSSAAPLSPHLFLTPSISTSSGTSSDWEALDSDIAEIAAAAEKTKEAEEEDEEEDEDDDDDDDDEEKDSDDDLPEDSQLLDWFISDHQHEGHSTVEDISEQLLGLEYDAIKNKLFLAPDEEWDNAVRDMEAEVLGALQLEGNEDNLKGLNLSGGVLPASSSSSVPAPVITSVLPLKGSPIPGTLPATPLPAPLPSGVMNFGSSSSAPPAVSPLGNALTAHSNAGSSPCAPSPLSLHLPSLYQPRVPTPALGGGAALPVVAMSKSSEGVRLRSATTATSPIPSASFEFGRTASPPPSGNASPSSSGNASPAEPRKKEKDSLVRFLHRRKPEKELRTTAGHLLLYHDPNVPFPDTTAGKKEKLEKKEKLWRKRWVSADTVMNVYKRVGDSDPILTIPLSSIISVSVAEKDKSMSFAVVCAERTFHFQAHNRDDLNEWLAHLEARGAFLLKALYLQTMKKVRVDQARISAAELKALVIAKFVESGISSLADARAADHYGLFVPHAGEWIDESRVIRTEVLRNFEIELKLKPRE